MRNYKHLLENIVFNNESGISMNTVDFNMEIAREIFRSHNYFLKKDEWDGFICKLIPKDKQKLGDLSHFYFFLFRSEYDENTRNELILVVTTSIIEKLESEIKFLNFFDWYKKQKKKIGIQGKFKDILNKLETDYLKEHGATKKIEYFFNKHINTASKAHLLDSIEKYNINNKKFEKLKSIEEVAKFMYAMRSDFVHKAEMRNFCPRDCIGLGASIDKKTYDLSLTAESFIQIFEEAFIDFYMQKVDKVDKNGT